MTGSTTGPRGRAATVRRRTVGICVAALAAVGLVVTVWIWVPLVALLDLLRGRPRLPTLRLLAFGTAFAWLELAGVGAAAWLWLTGRAGDIGANRRLQRWWAHRVMGALRVTCGLVPTVEGIETLAPGPVILLVRHASLADSLLTAWAVMDGAGMWPRVIMKKELLVDPCLDIVGNRLPNCFVDRGAADSAPELAAIARMGSGMSSGECAVIFPEGTRANPDKRRRALERIAESDPSRAGRLEQLTHLLPPRTSGARALLGAAPGADVVLGWHVGFEGLDDFGGIIDAIGSGRRNALIRFERHGRESVPDGEGFREWLDDRWLDLDAEVDRALG